VAGDARGSSGGLRGAWGRLGRFLGCKAGHVEQALVLLVGFVQHGSQLRDMFSVREFPLLIEPCLFPFSFLHQAELFT